MYISVHKHNTIDVKNNETMTILFYTDKQFAGDKISYTLKMNTIKI